MARIPMAIGEWYHCYTRGVDKRIVFEEKADFERFLVHLFVANNTKNIRVSDLTDVRLESVLANPSLLGEKLIDIGVYTLMSNHVHLVTKEIREGGTGDFMHKVFTGYTKYFNNKYDRTGALFSSTYKSKHITDDRYLKQVVPYILLNPIELFEPEWKTSLVNLTRVDKKLLEYPYSSLLDFLGTKRPKNVLVGKSLPQHYDSIPTLESMLTNAQQYYLEHVPQA